MSDSKLLGRVIIKEVKDNSNGTCTLELEIPDDLKENLKQSLGWKRWSSKFSFHVFCMFNQFFLEALTKHAKDMERELGNLAPSDQRGVDVFDSKLVQSDS